MDCRLKLFVVLRWASLSIAARPNLVLERTMKHLALVCTVVAFGLAALGLYVSVAPASNITATVASQINVLELLRNAKDLPDNTVIESF